MALLQDTQQLAAITGARHTLVGTATTHAAATAATDTTSSGNSIDASGSGCIAGGALPVLPITTGVVTRVFDRLAGLLQPTAIPPRESV
jgi:hypothetical protein